MSPHRRIIAPSMTADAAPVAPTLALLPARSLTSSMALESDGLKSPFVATHSRITLTARCASSCFLDIEYGIARRSERPDDDRGLRADSPMFDQGQIGSGFASWGQLFLAVASVTGRKVSDCGPVLNQSMGASGCGGQSGSRRTLR